MFQYPNQNDVLARNTEYAEMQNNIGKKIRFSLYDKKMLPCGEKVGEIVSVQHPDYFVRASGRFFLVSKDDYISIF